VIFGLWQGWAFSRVRGPYGVQTPDFDYGASAFDIRDHVDFLRKEPCDRARAVEYVRALVRAGDNRGAIGNGGAFLERCGEHEELRWVLFEARKRLSDWNGAIAEADRLIALDPGDKDYWWWRATAREQRGDDEGAISDFRQSLLIRPDLDGVPFALAAVLERQGRPCEAIVPIEQFLHYHPSARDEAPVVQRLARLWGPGGCAPGEGEATISFPHGAQVITVMAQVNGHEPAPFILDTGATWTVLSEDFARALGIGREEGSSVVVQTAAGPRTARHLAVDEIRIQGVVASRVPIAILAETPEGTAGLLGLSFLARFRLTVDPDAGTVHLMSRGN
jgi:aspartyl protease family protein